MVAQGKKKINKQQTNQRQITTTTPVLEVIPVWEIV